MDSTLIGKDAGKIFVHVFQVKRSTSMFGLSLISLKDGGRVEEENIGRGI